MSFRVLLSISALSAVASADEGAVCSGCIIVVRLIDMQLQQGVVLDPLVDSVCTKAFSRWQRASKLCSAAWSAVGPEVIRQLEHKVPESEICKGIRLCPKDSKCRLLPAVEEAFTAWRPSYVVQHLGLTLHTALMDTHFPWPWTNVINHRPANDLDGDGFSDASTLRGSDWRGKDCNDLRKDVYPGRRTRVRFAFDHNCNGIPDSHEEELCENSEMRRLIILGDSAAAHFHVPLTMNSSNPYLGDQLAYMLENELDYPQWSWGTGFDFGSNKTSFPDGDVDSLYMRMVDRNRCNTNFRQNLGVNGARSTSVVPDKTDSMASDPDNDLPAIVFYAMVGNDVINAHIPEVENARHQTSPAEFRHKVMEALAVLDKRLPRGSHVVLLGLEHGGDLWPQLQHRAHPGLSIPGSIVTYRDVWGLVNCNGANPGFGWLEPNASYREHTSQLAQNLSNVLQDIAVAHNDTFSSFDLTYIENPDKEIADAHLAHGGDYADLIEWVGGGHPSQTMHARTAQKIWETLEQIRPDILGPMNPHNEKIDTLFSSSLVV